MCERLISKPVSSLSIAQRPETLGNRWASYLNTHINQYIIKTGFNRNTSGVIVSWMLSFSFICSPYSLIHLLSSPISLLPLPLFIIPPSPEALFLTSPLWLHEILVWLSISPPGGLQPPVLSLWRCHLSPGRLCGAASVWKGPVSTDDGDSAFCYCVSETGKQRLKKSPANTMQCAQIWFFNKRNGAYSKIHPFIHYLINVQQTDESLSERNAFFLISTWGKHYAAVFVAVKATAFVFHIFKTSYYYPFIFEHTYGHYKLCAIIIVSFFFFLTEHYS